MLYYFVFFNILSHLIIYMVFFPQQILTTSISALKENTLYHVKDQLIISAWNCCPESYRCHTCPVGLQPDPGAAGLQAGNTAGSSGFPVTFLMSPVWLLLWLSHWSVILKKAWQHLAVFWGRSLLTSSCACVLVLSAMCLLFMNSG